ncbi:MAG TPA: LysR substrate-binding domain-containing protein [Verrucomicrobiae bacterium]|jgi:LysR family hydrogen peroxide-inducible transcriptional activator|nr:LysR substrate-binding domain-containing protein [Verrucomicrobiae bacterium]
MEIHQLRYVAAVARTRNFSRAAEQCHVAQPSLSQQIQKLEEELGERLFDRLKREARLTSHGEVFLRRAVRILEEVEAAKREAADTHALLRGTLKIGVLPTIAPYLLPGVMEVFMEKYPGVEIVVQEDTTAQLLKFLLAFEIDLALASQPIRDGRLEVRELFTEELLLALPPSHPLTRKRAINASDLERERLIVMKEGHCLGDQVLQFCEQRESHPNISFRSAQLETIQSLVSAGLGLSLIPAMAARSGSKDLPEYRSFQSPKPQRKIVAVWPKQRPPVRASTEFLKIVEVRFSKSPQRALTRSRDRRKV